MLYLQRTPCILMKFPQGKRRVVEEVKLQGKMVLLFCYLTGYRSEGWWDVLLAHKEKAELGSLLPLRLGEEALPHEPPKAKASSIPGGH